MTTISAYEGTTKITGERHELTLRFAANRYKKGFALYELTVKWVHKTGQKMKVSWPEEDRMRELIREHLDLQYNEVVDEDRLPLKYFFIIRKNPELIEKGRKVFMGKMSLLTTVQWSAV